MNEVQQKVAAFFDAYPVRKLDKSQIIIHPDDMLREVLYVVHGRINQYDITPGGVEMVVNVFKPGAFFPMSAALNHTPPGYFFGAATEAEVRAAPAVKVVKFLKDNPDVLLDLLSRVYRGVDGVLRRMTHLMASDTQSRLTFELLNVAYRFGEPRPDGTIFVALNESDLARHAGLARETVSRTLQKLKKEDLVQVVRGGLAIKSIESLQKAMDARS
jgi:CRP/FNR family cyclic AMP-dependent transcriptional regulator